MMLKGKRMIKHHVRKWEDTMKLDRKELALSENMTLNRKVYM